MEKHPWRMSISFSTGVWRTAILVLKHSNFVSPHEIITDNLQHLTPLTFPHAGRVYTAEQLVLTAVRHKNIGPLAMHLFALVTPDLSRWYTPNEEIVCPEVGHIRLLFRLRLKPHMKHLEGLSIGIHAFEYIFLQVGLTNISIAEMTPA